MIELKEIPPEKTDQMIANFEAYIVEIVETISKEIGDTLNVSTLRLVSRPAGDARITDGTLAFFVDGHISKDDIALLVSNPDFPSAVGDDVNQAARVASLVSGEVGDHIIAPVFRGEYGNQTYVAFSRLSPISSHRLPRIVQKWMVSGRIVTWLGALAKETRDTKTDSERYSYYFIRPLDLISADPEMPQNIRQCAKRCADYVTKNRPKLFTVVEHGDFWIGNVLFQARPLPDFNPFLGDFTVIDWKGSRTDGYPCIDLVRYLSSIFRNGSTQSDRLVSRYIGDLNISEFEMCIYSLLSMGRLGTELDQFPKDKYHLLCSEIFEFLQVHSLTEAS